ncbi:MAG TPA: hypothetical protein VK152_11420 [Paludibacter sp.]|nr:hypothetical protein [Paludibacter sp.]
MRKTLIIVIGLMFFQWLISQEFECVVESKQLYDEILVENIISCCHDFWGSDSSENTKHKILYMDIKVSGDTDTFILKESYVSNGLLMKRPDAIVKTMGNLALIYSKNYKFANDSIWLKHVYNMCKETTYETSFEIISWKRNIYKRINYKNPAIKLNGFVVPDSYHRYGPNKYIFVKNILVSESISDEIIHKYNFFPKNIDEPWSWEDKYYRKNLVDFVEIDSIK